MANQSPISQIWTTYNPDALDAQDRPRYTLFDSEAEAKLYALAHSLDAPEYRDWTEYMLGVQNVEDRRTKVELVSKFSVLIQHTDNKGVQLFPVFGTNIDEAIGNAIETACAEWDEHPDCALALMVIDGHPSVLRTEV